MSIKESLVNFGSKALFDLKEKSPEIALGVGLIGFAGAAYLACKATLKVEEIVEWKEEKEEKVQKALDLNDPEKYSEEDAEKDLYAIKVQSTVKFVKTYAPAVGLFVLSAGLVLYSHGEMKKRLFALSAAYKTLETGFNEYRKRVRADAGDEKDFEYRTGMKYEKVIDSETGEEKTILKKVDYKDKDGNPLDIPTGSVYGRFFDESNPRYSKSPGYNVTFLSTAQRNANDRLRARGFVTLNEIYEVLGFPQTTAGQVMGWSLGDNSDKNIDFGYQYDTAFLSGEERSVYLDFNVANITDVFMDVDVDRVAAGVGIPPWATE